MSRCVSILLRVVWGGCRGDTGSSRFRRVTAQAFVMGAVFMAHAMSCPSLLAAENQSALLEPAPANHTGVVAIPIAAISPGAAPDKILAPVALQRPVVSRPIGPASGPLQQSFDWKVIGVVAAVFGAVVLLKLYGKRRVPTLPPDVFDVLGEASLGGQQTVRIVRFGPKTLLVSVSAAGCHTLSELSDPQATACIAAACRGDHPPLRSHGIGRSGPRSLPTPLARPTAEQGVA
ncbi:MAG: flagellar biosynthetic protein FliO [Planctomycetota bacterium]